MDPIAINPVGILKITDLLKLPSSLDDDVVHTEVLKIRELFPVLFDYEYFITHPILALFPMTGVRGRSFPDLKKETSPPLLIMDLFI